MITSYTPTWNQEPWLLDRSVRSAVDVGMVQRSIVVDDGSDDPVSVGPMAEVVRIKHGGLPAAYAAFLAAIDGRGWVLRHPSDDEVLCDPLPALLANLQRRPALAYYFPWVAENDHGHRELVTPHRDAGSLLRQDNSLYGGATLIAASVLRAIGPHPDELRHACDWYLHQRIQAAVGWQYLEWDEPLMLRGCYSRGMHANVNQERLLWEIRWVRKQRVLG